jgi:hypothetical protein
MHRRREQAMKVAGEMKTPETKRTVTRTTKLVDTNVDVVLETSAENPLRTNPTIRLAGYSGRVEITVRDVINLRRFIDEAQKDNY